jgi:hypothetical protein
MFMVHINISSFVFSHPKIFLRLLVPSKFSINTLGPYFKINLYVDFIFFNEIFQKSLEYFNNHSKKRKNFLTKHELNVNS